MMALAADVILVAQTNVMLMEAEQMPPKITDGSAERMMDQLHVEQQCDQGEDASYAADRQRLHGTILIIKPPRLKKMAESNT